jgi:hypothetical protein
MMLGRRSLWVLVVGLTLGILFVLVIRSPRAWGQQNFPQPNRRPACTCFCGDGTFKSFNVFSSEDAKAGKCYGGPLPIEACGQMGREMPAEQKRAICKGLKASRSASCPSVKAFCDGRGDDGSKPDCEKPAPWFDPPADCKEVQAPVVAINNRAVTISICGLPVFRGAPTPPVDDVSLSAYKTVISGHITETVGSRVCCDKVRESARSGNPCFPGVDIDCDGVPNANDTTQDSSIVYPDIDLFTKANNAKIDDFPPGLNPDDKDFLPGPTARASEDVGDCPCKWELTAGKLTCSPDGQQDHVYTATWKCPANGKEVFTTKSAKATAPCKEYKRTGSSSQLPEYLYPRSASLIGFVPWISHRSTCGSGDL